MAPNGGEAARCFHDFTGASAHFCQKLTAEPGHAVLVVLGRFLELRLGFGLDVDRCDHRDESLDSSRSKTSCAGLPCEWPALTRSARRAISASHSSARLAVNSRGAIASTTMRRSSSESSDASSITLRTAASDLVGSVGHGYLHTLQAHGDTDTHLSLGLLD